MDCPLCRAEGEQLLEADDRLRVIEVLEPRLPGYRRIIWQQHRRELTELNEAERSHWFTKVAQQEDALRALWACDKINHASFGNLVPHLHWHVMPRWRTDPWWPSPIWGSKQPSTRMAVTQNAQGQFLLGPDEKSCDPASPLTLQLDEWLSLREPCAAVRQKVFVEEQNVAAEEEWDELDWACRHLLITNAIAPMATGRLLSLGDGRARIGRMAVLKEFRGHGLGRTVLQGLIAEARRLGFSEIILHAQTHALGFYARSGFAAQGPEFDECRIAHREMVLRLERG